MADGTAVPGGCDQGADVASPTEDATTVSLSVPLPPMPFVTEKAPPVRAPHNKLHPDASNWNTPDEVPEIPVGPAIDESLISEAEVGDPAHDDNIEAAMAQVAEDMDLTVSTRVSDDDGPADKQILIRATESDRERWKRAAEVEAVSLSALIRSTMNTKVTEILDCTHPLQFRKSYPWAEFCTKCDMRLHG